MTDKKPTNTQRIAALEKEMESVVKLDPDKINDIETIKLMFVSMQKRLDTAEANLNTCIQELHDHKKVRDAHNPAMMSIK